MITPDDITQMWKPWRDRNLSPRTQRQYNQALKWCLRYMQVPEKFLYGIPHIKGVRPRGNILSLEAIDTLLSAAPTHMRLYILLCSDVAIRAGTVVRLCENDWDHDNGCFRFTTKANVVVALPVTKRLRAMIDMAHTYKADTGTPYLKRIGGPDVYWQQHSYGRQLKLLQAELGIRPAVTSHDLRRSAARRMYEVTKDLRVVQALLGHTNIASTFHYLYPHMEQVTTAQMEACSVRTS